MHINDLILPNSSNKVLRAWVLQMWRRPEGLVGHSCEDEGYRRDSLSQQEYTVLVGRKVCPNIIDSGLRESPH
jgi:hypothetical protein